MDKVITLGREAWIFRPLWAKKAIVQDDFFYPADPLVSAFYYKVDLYHIKTWEWFAIVGFIAIFGLGILILFK